MDDCTERNWKLYHRAIDILEGRARGQGLPIIRKLARRRFQPAVNVLIDFLPEGEAIRLLRREARHGDGITAYNLAIMHLNRGDMLNYRTALARAAKLDPEAAIELRRFQTRFPHQLMRRFRRLAPERD